MLNKSQFNCVGYVQYKDVEYKTMKTNILEEIYQWSNAICISLTKGNESSYEGEFLFKWKLHEK